MSTSLADGTDPLERAVTAAGAATAASGLGLLVAPRLVLRLLGAGRTEPAPFLFRVIGMFMGVTGGLLFEGSRGPAPSRVALRWALVGKVGAAVLVSSAVRSRRFGRQGAVLAVVDGASAGLIALLLRRSRP